VFIKTSFQDNSGKTTTHFKVSLAACTKMAFAGIQCKDVTTLFEQDIPLPCNCNPKACGSTPSPSPSPSSPMAHVTSPTSPSPPTWTIEHAIAVFDGVASVVGVLGLIVVAIVMIYRAHLRRRAKRHARLSSEASETSDDDDGLLIPMDETL